MAETQTIAEIGAGKTDSLSTLVCGTYVVPYGPAKVMLLEKYHTPVMDRVAALKCTSADVIIASFPKSGTVWTQAITSLILHTQGSKPIDLDTSDVKDDWPYLESNIPVHQGELPIEILKKRNPPRMIRTHLSWDLLPQSAVDNKAKIIYVHRKVKDVIVSAYEMFRSLDYLASAHAVDSFDAFAESFMQDNVLQAPYFHKFKSYWEHWDEPNVHHICYEKLHEAAPHEIKRLAEFLEKPLTDEQVQEIAYYTEFENMIKIKKLNDYGLTVKDSFTGVVKFHFMRKGKVSGWKSHISEEFSKKIDDWIHNEAKKYGLDKVDTTLFL